MMLLALLALTAITAAAARFDFGNLNAVVAMLIASMRGSLVALFFMPLRHDRFNDAVFVLGLFFLAVFLIWTLFDLSTSKTVLPGNLKQPVQAFPDAPRNMPIPSSTGQPLGAQRAQ